MRYTISISFIYKRELHSAYVHEFQRGIYVQCDQIWGLIARSGVLEGISATFFFTLCENP